MATVTTVRDLATIEAEIQQTKEALNNVRGSETEVYARIVGYYRSVRNWNKGKRDEYNQRKLFVYNNESNDTPQNDAIVSTIQTIKENSEKASSISVSDKELVRYELFARKTCPNCPPVKEYMSHVELSGELFDVDSEDGFQKAKKLGIMSSPTVVFYNNEGKEVSRAHNTTDLAAIFQTENLSKAC